MNTRTFIAGIFFALLLIGGSIAASTYYTARTIVETLPGRPILTKAVDLTERPIEYYMYRDLNAVTLAAPTTSRSNTIELVAGHLVVPNDYLNIYIVNPDYLGSGSKREDFIQVRVVSVATNTLRVDKFLGVNIELAHVVFANRVSINQNVVGTIDNPIRFELCVPGNQVWDLTRILPSMILSGQPDDAKFGDQPALTNGVFYGFESDLADGYVISIIDNAGFRATAYDVQYTARAGGSGSWGLSTRKSFAGPDKYGVAIRLEGYRNDCFVKYVSDDLSLLLQFNDKMMGHRADEEVIVE